MGGEESVRQFLKETSGKKRFIYYTGHGSSPEGAWCCNGQNAGLKPSKLLQLIELHGGTTSTGIAADCCYAGKTVEKLCTCAFVIGASLPNETSTGQFCRWLFSDCDSVPPVDSKLTMAGRIF